MRKKSGLVQPPAAAPPGIDPMILQQQQAAAQEAALQQVTSLNLPPNRIYLFSSQSTNFISEYKSVFSLGIGSQIRFLGERKTSCWNINLQRASQEANGGSRSGQKNGSRPQLHQCGKYFRKKVFLVIRPQNDLNIQIQSGIHFFTLIYFTYDPIPILAILLDLQRQAMYGGPFISH